MGDYNIFISHAWRYGDDYNRLIALLDKAIDFSYKNYSAPEHKPLQNLDSTDARTRKDIEEAITRKIRPCSCILVISGMYANYSYWMKYEIDDAYKQNKHIISIKPWGSERVPSYVQEKSNVIVGWNTSVIVEEIRKI